MNAPHAGLSLEDGLDLSGLSVRQLWLRQYSIGGTATLLEVEAYLLGLLTTDRHTHNVLAQALNEYFLDRGEDHPVAYWTPSQSGSRHDG